MRHLLLTIALSIIVCATASAATPVERELLATVRGFYTWTLQNSKQTEQLEPRISDIPGSTRFYLDTSTLDAFAASYIASGYFAPEFRDAVARYYLANKKEFDAWTQEEFDSVARDGRGPLMDTEDMDIFFCAQEYEYKADFIQGMKIKSSSIAKNKAIAVVLSPYSWETTFSFVKIKDRWLISGYCVYQ